MVHSVATLRYQLLEGPLNLEPLRVLEQRTVSWQDTRVTFYVLGASHAVQIEHGDTCITELLTCAPLTNAGRILSESAVIELREWHVAAPGLQCCIQVEPFALADEVQISDWFAEANTLSVSYPPHLDGQTDEYTDEQIEGQMPLTRLAWRFEHSFLFVYTVHTYPEEGRGVITRTIFTMTNRAPLENLFKKIAGLEDPSVKTGDGWTYVH